jgi:hypothetical protein
LFPEPCAKVSERYLSLHRVMTQQKQQRMKRAVQEIAMSLHDRGIYPSYDQVASRLPRPWQLRQREVNRIWKEISTAPTGARPGPYQGLVTDDSDSPA